LGLNFFATTWIFGHLNGGNIPESVPSLLAVSIDRNSRYAIMIEVKIKLKRFSWLQIFLVLQNSWLERKILFKLFIISYSLTCQATDTLNELMYSSKGRNTLNEKCFRRRVWETRHSGATGWEHLFHFSGVWCSSLLQLTRSSNWQLESLFWCQMWPHWM